MPILLVLASLILAAPFSASAQERPLPFDKGWTFAGEGTQVVSDGTRHVLVVETGFAHYPDAAFQDGTIDFDVQLTPRRSFVYVYFRGVAPGEREEFYLRPHKSNLPDAVQYAPVWQGRSAWQLHHGPGGTAAVGFEHGAWTHVRVVVQGSRAAIFVHDLTTPALVVPRLARAPKAGYIAVGGFLPAGVPGSGPIARFANVSVSRDVRFDLDKAAAAAPAPAAVIPAAIVIREWAVSRAYTPTDAAQLPAADVTGAFTTLRTDADGLLNLHRHVPVPEGSRVSAAVARVAVRAAQAGTYALDLGYSDIATVFVNGTPIFRGDSSYSFDRPRRDGLIGFDQARVYLPLRAGENEVAIVVSDSFGGWGIMGRLVRSAGLTVQAR